MFEMSPLKKSPYWVIEKQKINLCPFLSRSNIVQLMLFFSRW
ncbi:hypothetical protein C4K23_2604 [Pseudomonas chlororaphis]|nr:hypothetical protein C4K23_2604 [Pseudomonas chlororaphis]